MNDAERPILVPIDLHGIDPRNLEVLVRIARQLRRGLLGLFLEDLRLQEVADLPFTTEIVLSSGRERGLQRIALRRLHGQVAEQTRKRLQQLAQREEVPLQFEEASGSRWHSVLQQAHSADVFLPARPRWSDRRAARHGQRAVPGLGLVLGGGSSDARSVALAAALQRAGLVGRIYLLAESAPPRDALEQLARPGVRLCVQANAALDSDSLCSLIRQSSYPMLILPGERVARIPAAELDAALDRSGGQVLVVN